MKITKKKLIYSCLELFFIAILPLILVFIEYSNIGNTAKETVFKISFSGILLVVLVLYIVKKTLFKRKIEKLRGAILQHESDLKIENDKAKIVNIEKVLRNEKTFEVLVDAAIPIASMFLLIIVCKALEQCIVALSGAVGFILISFLLGTVFSILSAREVRSKHKNSEEEIDG